MQKGVYLDRYGECIRERHDLLLEDACGITFLEVTCPLNHDTSSFVYLRGCGREGDNPLKLSRASKNTFYSLEASTERFIIDKVHHDNHR